MKTPRFFYGGLLVLALAGMAGPVFALTVRVAAPQGVPQIMVDGQPEVARIFYGGVGWEPIKVMPGEQKISFEFVAVDTEGAAQMQIRFAPAPGNFSVDDIHLVDTADNSDVLAATQADPASAWVFSPPNASDPCAQIQENPGQGHEGSTQFQIAQHAPPGVWVDTPDIYNRHGFSVQKGHRYRVDFMVQSDVPQAVSVVIYRPRVDEPYQIIGASNEPLFRQVQLAAQSGVRLITVPILMPWPRPGNTMDTSYADAVCDYILTADPQALIIPRININAPVWWIASHPDDEMRWAGQKKNKARAATIASHVYRQEAEAHLTAFLQHLETAYGRHMAGYHIAGGNSNEWFYEDSHSAALQGYAPADLPDWRQWLAAHYASDAELQKAWGRQDVTLQAAQVPAENARRAAPDGVFFNPVTQREVMDWNQYQQDEMAGFVCELAHLVRQNTQGNKLVLFFYGYLFEFAALQMGPSSSGHCDLRKVLDCPDIDLLCAPISYYDRNTGGSAPLMTDAESVALAGKLWIMEDDVSTHLSLTYINPPGSKDRTHSLDETLQVVLRNGAEATLRNMGTWWMDLCRNGWFDDPGLWKSFDAFRPAQAEMLKLRQPFHPEVAAVLDDENMLLLTPRSYAVGQPILLCRGALGRMGAPYGQYLEDDVLAGRVSDAKLYVFLNAWRMTAAQRTALKQQTTGKTCLWGYGAGYFDGDTASLDAMHDLTGFQVKPVTVNAITVTPTEAGTRLGLPNPLSIANAGVPRPLFAVTDAQADEVLATFSDGSAAIALRHTAAGVSIFCGTPTLTPELLRIAADAAGVHLYTRTNAVVFANGPFLAIHGTDEGPLAVDTGRPGNVVDVMTGEALGPGPQINLPIRKGQTRILRY